MRSGVFTFVLAFVAADELRVRVSSFRFTSKGNYTKSLRPFQESIRRLRWLHWFRLLWFSQRQKLVPHFPSTWSPAQWLAKDIDQVFFRHAIPRLSIFVLKISIQIDDLPDDTEIVYSFWNGMPPKTQIRVLELSSSCRSVRKLAVFRDDNWSKPEKGQLHFSFLSSTCVLFETMHL